MILREWTFFNNFCSSTSHSFLITRKPTKSEQKGITKRGKASFKFSTLQPLINASFPPRPSTTVREKIPKGLKYFTKHKILLTIPSENPLKNVKRASLSSTPSKTPLPPSQKGANAKVFKIWYPMNIRRREKWKMKKILDVIVSVLSVWNCIVNVSKGKYFVINIVSAMIVEILKKTKKNIKKPSLRL